MNRECFCCKRSIEPDRQARTYGEEKCVCFGCQELREGWVVRMAQAVEAVKGKPWEAYPVGMPVNHLQWIHQNRAGEMVGSWRMGVST